MSDFDNVPNYDGVPIDGIEILDDEISFGTERPSDETVILSDADTVLDVAAPAIAIGTVAPLAAAIVRETERVDVVEETIDAPVAVISEPEPVVAAPIAEVVEPVHHVRWPWALLALPLLAIPFINRPAQTPVAEPVVVQTPVVRERVVAEEPAVKVTPAPKVVAEAPAPAPVATPLPTCDTDFIVKDSVDLLADAGDTSTVVQTIAANTVVNVDAVEGTYYHVVVGADDGYVPITMVVCNVALAPATVTG